VVSQILELAQFIDEYRMAQVQIRRGRVESGLYAQRPTGVQTRDEFALEEDLLGPAFDFIQGSHRTALSASRHSAGERITAVRGPEGGARSHHRPIAFELRHKAPGLAPGIGSITHLTRRYYKYANNFDSQGMRVKACHTIDDRSPAGYGVIARKDWIFNQLQHYIKAHPY
jgi:hypothetical protein